MPRARQHTFFFGTQREWIEPNKPVPALGPLPKTTLRQRIFMLKIFRVEVRLEPHRDLAGFGRQVSEKLNLQVDHPQTGDRAIFVYGWSYGWTAKIAAVVFLDWLGEGLPRAQIVGGAIRLARVPWNTP